MRKDVMMRTFLGLLPFIFAAALPAVAKDPQPSWNDTASKQAIVTFVATGALDRLAAINPGGTALAGRR
jgi:hypothetical protein